jgi:uncharacterized membrane protein
MDELFGLPAHPLVVHAPVVLLPLAVIGAIAMMLRPSWYLHFRWPVLAIAAFGTVGAIFAASSGEEFEELVEDSKSGAAREAIEEHAEAGDMARNLAIVFLVAVVAFVLLPWFLERRARAAASAPTAAANATSSAGPAWLKPVLMVFVALAAVGSLVTIIDAGHSGADSVWNDVGSSVDGGGDDDGDDEDDGD